MWQLLVSADLFLDTFLQAHRNICGCYYSAVLPIKIVSLKNIFIFMCSKMVPDTRMQVVEPVNRDPIQGIALLLRLTMSLAFWHSPIPL